MNLRLVSCVAIAVAALAPATGRAITIGFEGTIDSWNSSVLGTGAAVGDTFSGVLQADPTNPTVAASPTPFLTVYELPPFVISVLWGSVADVETGTRLFVFNDSSAQDAITFAATPSLVAGSPVTNPPQFPSVRYQAGFGFMDDGSDQNGDPTDDTHDMLSSTAFFLPTGLDGWISRLTLSRFTTNAPGQTVVDIIAQGTVKRLTVTTVPEPSTIGLLGFGLLGLLLRRRTRGV